MRIIQTFICGIAIVLSACCKRPLTEPPACHTDHQTDNASPTLTFGHFHGFCQGEKCVEIYRLTGQNLSEDIKDAKPAGTFYQGNFIPLSAEKYEDTRDLLNAFPSALLSENNSMIGHPDAADAGGYYVEYSYGSIHKFWLIDKMKNEVPAAYHSFMDKMEEKITKLSQ